RNERERKETQLRPRTDVAGRRGRDLLPRRFRLADQPSVPHPTDPRDDPQRDHVQRRRAADDVVHLRRAGESALSARPDLSRFGCEHHGDVERRQDQRRHPLLPAAGGRPVGSGRPLPGRAGHPASPLGQRAPAVAAHTPAGTRDEPIFSRSAVNSEMVRVATDATGRGLRPVASVLDTITTLSTYGWIVVAFCTVATITSWNPNLRNASNACCANCGSDL